MIDQRKMIDVVNENFERYAGNVILDRAICDVRDMLKPSARMLIYSQMAITKNTHKKPFIKSARVVGDCLGHLYEHGESSCYGSYMRMSKDFTMRVPLEECQGNNGTMTKNGDEAAMRYTELRLSEIASYLYNGLDKNAIGDNWRNNFDETEQYPGVMPSIGYFNICNGTQGLGIAISSSIPQFSLREVNTAIIKLIQDSDIADEDLIIMPDFATGGILINADEVYQALITGQGAACKLRAVMNYNPDANSILITELPYSVYSEVIKAQIHSLMEDESYGIKNIHDNSGKTPEIILELNKGINPKKMIEKLYKDTSLESHFTINMWVLKDGRFPQIMGLRQIFQEYITHIRSCKRREIQFDLDKALARKNIVEGLIKAYSIIDEVIALIKSSANPQEASQNLISLYNFNEEQTKAILAMRLSSLTKLDIVKLNEENTELAEKISQYNYLLKTPPALDNELIKILQDVANKFGDARRTKIINRIEIEQLVSMEEKEIQIGVFDNNIIKIAEKNNRLTPIKRANLIHTLYTTNLDTLIIFTDKGIGYSLSLSDLDYNNDYNIETLISIKDDENILLIIDKTSLLSYNSLVTISKQGYIKRSLTTEYQTISKRGINIVKLNENDMIINIFLSCNNEDEVFIINNNGYYNRYMIKEISSTGRMSKGIKAIGLKENEFVTSATIIKKDIEYYGLLTICSNGKGKITSLTEFKSTARGARGTTVTSLKEDSIADLVYAVPINKKHIYIIAKHKSNLLRIEDIPFQNRNTIGVYLIKLKQQSTIKIM